LKGSFVAVGGHNFLPPDDSPLAAAVMVAPGGPAHVMLTDRVAEHIPGCNMAFYKWSLEEIAGFDPIFEKAGDDVDVCWRLQQRGYKIGFSPGGFVWHYRRSTVGAYLRQQRGYGEAEALLVRRHPEYFNSFGSSMWQGKIYSSAASGVTLRRPMIYHGSFGTGFFQSVYRAAPAFALMLCTTLEYHALVTLPLLVLSVPFHYLIPLAVTSVAVSIVVCIAAAVQAELPANKYRFWSRPVIALMFFLQPILRGWARYQGRLAIGPTPQSAMRGLSSRDMKDQPDEFRNVNFWGDVTVDRLDFVRRIIARLEEQGWQLKVDAGWSNFDLEILGSRWAHLQLTTVSEPQGDGKQLLRSRLLTAWSLFAKVILGAITAFDLLVIGFVGTEIWWLWSLLLTIPAFAWFVRNEQRDLRKLIAVIINDVARQNGLTKVNLDKPKEKSVPEHN
ncbi:MAG: glycosyltransferase family 2 protein, partial [Limisphaerales bacterium]